MFNRITSYSKLSERIAKCRIRLGLPNMKLIDLTHSFTDKMPVYPGDPEVSFKQVASVDKEGYTDHMINSTMHVGTHIDAPLHMIESGKKIDEIALDKFFGNGVLIDGRGKKQIDSSLLKNIKIEKESIVLIYTGFGEKYRTKDYYVNYPHITEDFAEEMVKLGVKIVGMDILGPDEPPFPTHKILLSHEILIVENLTNLNELLGVQNFEVIAIPAKYHADAAPIRVIAKVLEY